MRVRRIALAKQIMLTMAASLGYMTIGLVRGYSSSAVPSMQETDPDLIPNESFESWISAIPPLGAAMGSLLAGPILQRFGRKLTLLSSAPLSILGWSLIATANSTGMILAARWLTGLCAGIITPSAQVYVSECSDPEIRGVLGSLPALFMAGGILLAYIMGTWLPWKSLAWATVSVPVIMLVVLLPLPESPAWLLTKGRTKAAEKSAKWLHLNKSSTTDVPMEIKTTVYTVTSNEEAKLDTTTSVSSSFSRAELFRRPVMIPLLLSLALLIFQQISGIDAIIFYTVAIFRAAGGPVDDHLATILVGLVQLVTNSLSLFFIDRSGRRPLLIASGFIMSASMASLGTYFYLDEKGEAAELGLLPLISLLVFMVGFSIGYCSIPFLLMGEILPEKQRSIFSSIAGTFNLGVMFLVIKTYPDLKSLMGFHGTFWFYSVNCLASCFFVAFLLPETKGKSLQEIEEYFELKHTNRKTVTAK